MLYSVLLTHMCDRILGLQDCSPPNPSPTGEGEKGGSSRPIDLGDLQHVSKHLEDWVMTALQSYPTNFVACRVELASRAAHLCSRLAGLAQLVSRRERVPCPAEIDVCTGIADLYIPGQAQALSNILRQQNVVDDTIRTWLQLDFETLVNQCALMTDCSQDVIQSYLDQFYRCLHTTKDNLERAFDTTSGIGGCIQFADESLRHCAASLDAALVIGGHDIEQLQHGDSSPNGEPDQNERRLNQRSFLLKWHYICGQVLRELTIKSSPSFGTFQIISLFLE